MSMTVEETLSALDRQTGWGSPWPGEAAGHIRRLQGELADLRADRNRCVELNALHAKRIAELTAELEGERTIPKDCDECEVAVRNHVRDDLEMWKEKYLALRAETADLREVERCLKSIREAGDYTLGPFSVPECQAAERAAWERAAKPYRARTEAAGYKLLLFFGGEGLHPVNCQKQLQNGNMRCYEIGEHGGYPTLDLLEQAAAWAEAHPETELESRMCADCSDRDASILRTPCALCFGNRDKPHFRPANQGIDKCPVKPCLASEPTVKMDLSLIVNPNGAVEIDGVKYDITSWSLTIPSKIAGSFGDPTASCTCGYEHECCEGCKYDAYDKWHEPCDTCDDGVDPCAFEPV